MEVVGFSSHDQVPDENPEPSLFFFFFLSLNN